MHIVNTENYNFYLLIITHNCLLFTLFVNAVISQKIISKTKPHILCTPAAIGAIKKVISLRYC